MPSNHMSKEVAAMPHPLQPWHMQPGESSRSFNRFCIYRDLGPARSLRKARQACGDGTVCLREWELESSEHRWVERVRAYDQHLDDERTAAVLEQWKANSQAAANLVWAVLAHFGTDPTQVGSHDLPHLLREASKLSFLLSGTPTERLRQEVEANLHDDAQQANIAFLTLFEQLTGDRPGDDDG